MDSKQSGLKAATRKKFRTVLPRVSDAVHSCLDFMAAEFNGAAATEHEIEQLVPDVTDAFWSVPTPLDERRFVTIQFRGAGWCPNAPPKAPVALPLRGTFTLACHAAAPSPFSCRRTGVMHLFDFKSM